MAPFEQHARDCERFLRDRCEAANLWMDELFTQYGPLHRKYRHHAEGVEEARAKFGELGAAAAEIHILRDCRNIPQKADYDSGRADPLGLLRHWPMSAYTRYEEADFEALVMNKLYGPTGTILWSFIDAESVELFMTGVSKLTLPEVQHLQPQHEVAVRARIALQPIPRFQLPTVSIDEATQKVLDEETTAIIEEMKQSAPSPPHFAYVRVEDLITPLVFVDNEYLEELRAELISLSPADVLRFAIPLTINVPVRAMTDPTRKAVTFVSNQKTLSVAAVQVQRVPGGAEVKFVIAANLSAILVAETSNRLVLRNGIHRAFMLAKLGLKEIPCVLVKEESAPALMGVGYPTFTPQALLAPRPPMLLDFFDDALCVTLPLQRTHKMVRVSVEEVILPVD